MISDESDECPESVLGRHLGEEEADDRAEAGVVGEREEACEGLQGQASVRVL